MKKLSSGSVIEIFETLDSTSLEARRRIEVGETGPIWIVALQQHAGYGRRGRAWEQAIGDFSGTLFFNPEVSSEQLGQVSFVVALALASTLDEYISEQHVSLKWPNDVLLDGSKAAGILLEHIPVEASARLAIGIGLNVVTAPQGLPYSTARMVDYKRDIPSPVMLAEQLDAHFWRYYREWVDHGFGPIRDHWLARASGLGEAIKVRLPNEDLSGVFDGIDANGALILRLAAGKRIINAGEVFYGRQG